MALFGIKLHFQAPLHLSKGKIEYESSHEILHSDSLKSAIFVCGLQLGQSLDKSFFDTFRISSGFPFYGDEYFFPKPIGDTSHIQFPDQGLSEIQAAKKQSKLAFLGKSYFEALIQGKPIAVNRKYLHQKDVFLSNKCKQSEEIVIFKKEIQQRVTIPALGADNPNPTPFYLDRIYFAANAGLYFLVDTDKATFDTLKPMLKLLGDNGIGTDRHVGNGLFTPEFVEDFSLEIPKDNDAQFLLSLYCPAKEELTIDILHKSAYKLIRRGGYIASASNPDHTTFRKKSVYMFMEGSVFPKEDLKGTVSDLKPDIMEKEHSVFRDGQAFFIPMHSPKNSK